MEHFLEDVTQDDISEILKFSDNLKLCLKIKKQNIHSKKPVGNLSITKSQASISDSQSNIIDPNSIQINIQTDSIIDELASKSSCSGKISLKNFNVLKQSHNEEIEQTTSELVERSTVIEERDGIFYVKQEAKKNELVINNETRKSELSTENDSISLLAESGSFLFESLLARVGFHQEINLPWFDRSNIESLCQVRYRPLPDKKVEAVDGSSAVCYGIEKVIERKRAEENQENCNSSNSNKIIWHSYYLPDGKLVEREQISNENIKIISEKLNNQETTENIVPSLPFYAVVETMPPCSDLNKAKNNNKKLSDISENKGIDIESDVQMVSEYKRLHAFEYASNSTWLKEHPMTMSLLKDLTQHLLVHKPADPVLEMSKFFEV